MESQHLHCVLQLEPDLSRESTDSECAHDAEPGRNPRPAGHRSCSFVVVLQLRSRPGREDDAEAPALRARRACSRPSSDKATSVAPAKRSSAFKMVAPCRTMKTRVTDGFINSCSSIRAGSWKRQSSPANENQRAAKTISSGRGRAASASLRKKLSG